MSWQAQGAGGSGFGRSGGGTGSPWDGYLTPTVKRLLTGLALAYFVGLILRRLEFDGLVSQLALHTLGTDQTMPWQVFTYPFILAPSPGTFLFQILGIFFFAASVEQFFGTGRFYTFAIITLVGSGLIAMLLSPLLTGPVAITGVYAFDVALVFAFGWVNRTAQIRLWFLIPIPAIWFVYFLLFFEISYLVMGGPDAVHHLAAMGLTYLMVERKIPTPDLRRKWLLLKQRTLQGELDKERAQRKLELEKFELIRGGRDDEDDNDNEPMLH